MFLENLLNLFSTKICLICKKEILSEEFICNSCVEKIKKILDNYQPCPKCSLNNNLQNVFCYCNKKNFSFENNYSCLPFNEFYHKAFIDAKYHYKLRTLKFFINLALTYFDKQKLQKYKNTIDYIIPVPISHLKKYKRGYSISIIFANQLSKILKKKIINIFYEKGIKYSHLERKNKNFNLNKKFYTTKNKNKLQKIKGKNILLIDDIFTTGSTIDFLSKKLKNLGCNRIYSLTMLRTQFKI